MGARFAALNGVVSVKSPYIACATRAIDEPFFPPAATLQRTHGLSSPMERRIAARAHQHRKRALACAQKERPPLRKRPETYMMLTWLALLACISLLVFLLF